jgi:hypothetical protein
MKSVPALADFFPTRATNVDSDFHKASIGDIWEFEKLYIPLFWVMLKIEINNFFYARFIQDKVYEIAASWKGYFDW